MKYFFFFWDSHYIYSWLIFIYGSSLLIDCLLGNNDTGSAHTGTNAHGGDTNLLASSSQLGEQGRNLAGTGGTKRVTEGNGTTLGVDLVDINLGLMDGEESLRGKGLVNLVNVNVVNSETNILQDSGDGVSGTNTHDLRRNTNSSSMHKLAQNRLAELLGDRAAHQKNGASTIRNLRSVTGVGRTGLGESRLDLAKRLLSDTSSDSIILVDNNLLGIIIGIDDSSLDGDDLPP